MQRAAKSPNRSTRPLGGPPLVGLFMAMLLMALGACGDGPVAPVQVESELEVLVANDPLHSPSTRVDEECDPLYEVGRTCDGADDDHGLGDDEDSQCTPLSRACGGPGGGGTVPGSRGPLQWDEVMGAPTGEPDCSDPGELNAIERTWCEGDVPNAAYAQIVETAADSVLARCIWMSLSWSAVQGNIRLWHHQGENFGGGSRKDDDWMLLSYEWLDRSSSAAMARKPRSGGRWAAFRPANCAHVMHIMYS